VRHLLFKNEDTNELLYKTDYSQITSQIYREVIKRKKLWKVGEHTFKFNQDHFGQFTVFIERTLKFLEIRENTELFRHMNIFYSFLLKEMYLVSYSFKESLLQEHLSQVKDIRLGRVDFIQPLRSNPLKPFSAGLLEHVIKMLMPLEKYTRFRGINRRFNQCFEMHTQRRARGIEKAMGEYEGTNIVATTQQEIDDNLTIVKRINDLGA
jgi:hypothetical protein